MQSLTRNPLRPSCSVHASFGEAPHFAALADTFLFFFLLAAVLAAVTLTLVALQGDRGAGERRGITRAAVSAYAAGTLGFVLLLFAPTAMPALAVATGLLAGAALPWIVAAWARRVAAPRWRCAPSWS